MYVYLLYPARSSYISSEQGCAVTWCNISLSISLDGEYVIAQESRQRWNKLEPSVMLKGPLYAWVQYLGRIADIHSSSIKMSVFRFCVTCTV